MLPSAQAEQVPESSAAGQRTAEQCTAEQCTAEQCTAEQRKSRLGASEPGEPQPGASGPTTPQLHTSELGTRAPRASSERTLVDPTETITEYIDRADWRVNANANQDYSIGGLILNSAGKLIADYWLDQVFSPQAAAAHKEGAIHIHDLDVLGGYCAGWSLRALLEQGFNGVRGAVSSRPPKHLSSALGQMVNFLGTLQNEWAGAQAFSSADTYLAPYLRLDNLTDSQLHQQIQEFIHNLNVPSRWGTQAPFTNLTFDWTCPEDLKDQYPLVGEEIMDFTYGDLQPEMDRINAAFLAVYAEGDADGRPFTFPIPTYNITKDFDWDHPNTERLFAMTAKYGLPYFQNFVNSELNPGDIRSMCCRLQLDLRELLKRGNGLFGSSEQTGSIGVVTINLARLGYLHKGDMSALLSEMEQLVSVGVDTLERRRRCVEKLLEKGLYPYTARWLPSLNNHFSTIGVNGGNEMVRNFTDGALDITDPAGHAMAAEVLTRLRELLVQAQEETGHLYNLEATPAEGATYRFAKEDIARHPDILHAGTSENPYYTNSTQLPVGYTDDPFQALAMQEDLQTKYTGGTVLHLYTGEALDAGTAKLLVRRALTNFRLPYITITPTFSVCPECGYHSGEAETCPECGGEVEVWTRVMGYFRPVHSFNTGKKGEFRERLYFSAERVGANADAQANAAIECR